MKMRTFFRKEPVTWNAEIPNDLVKIFREVLIAFKVVPVSEVENNKGCTEIRFECGCEEIFEMGMVYGILYAENYCKINEQ